MSDLIERSEVLKQLWLNHKDVVYIDKKECARRIEAIPPAEVIPKGIKEIRTRALDFVDELIYYIFHVQDADDDNLSAELVCRKLLKHGLIDKVDGCYEPKDEPQAEIKGSKRLLKGKDEPFDKDINVRSKDEPQAEVDCDRCKHKGVYSYCHYCDGSGESFEPQTERSEE